MLLLYEGSSKFDKTMRFIGGIVGGCWKGGGLNSTFVRSEIVCSGRKSL